MSAHIKAMEDDGQRLLGKAEHFDRVDFALRAAAGGTLARRIYPIA